MTDGDGASHDLLAVARELASYGLNVLPAGFKQKAPALSEWRKFQEQRTDEKLHLWFGGTPRNFWVLAGRISRIVVVDCDGQAAVDWWTKRLGEDVLRWVPRVKTAKGYHYYFSIREGDAVASWSYHKDGIDFDVRAEGTGVIAPPSVHESGHQYIWEIFPASVEDKRRDEWGAPFPPMPDAVRGDNRTGDEGEGAPGPGPRSMLTKLLEAPPDKGGRNDWLTKVCGHYAKEYRDREDAYRFHVNQAARSLPDPLGPKEVEKIANSVWQKEHRKSEIETATFDEDNGYLVSGDRVILTKTKISMDGHAVWGIAPITDFDLKVTGVMYRDEDDGDEADKRTYDVTVLPKRGGSRQELLEATTVADSRRLAGWLANIGGGVLEPDGYWPNRRFTERLRRYLENQPARRFRVVKQLGWTEDAGDGPGFLTHDGIIRPDGLHGFETAKPHPDLRSRAPYRYGFLEEDTAVQVLREVLTFHHTETAAVFGAWWAACLIKPQILTAGASLFPLMAIEAPSESGKSKGMFELLIKLQGYTRPSGTWTKASLKHAMGSHHSGIVWVDDMDDPAGLFEVLRQATGDGTTNKMAEDNNTITTIKLVNPMVLAGEALNIDMQKAMRDRAVTLQVTSPTSRRSRHDPTRPQWDDIVALRRKYPDLTEVAGTLVQLALRHANVAEDLPSLRSGSARSGDKLAVLRVGARLLCRITGDPSWPDLVDDWVAEQEEDDKLNTVALKLMPQALLAWGMPDSIEPYGLGSSAKDMPTPVWIERGADGELDSGRVWVNGINLARWWSKDQNGRIDQRTETQAAITQQLKAMTETTTKKYRKDPSDRGSSKIWYTGLSRRDSRSVILRAMNEL